MSSISNNLSDILPALRHKGAVSSHLRIKYIKMMKKWVSTNDKRTRSAHVLANGQIVDMNEDFMVGGVPMEYAGDPKGGASNVINCRCVIIYADERDMN